MKEVAPFQITRIFKAPRELVFQAHSDVVHLSGWMGHVNSKVIKADLNFVPGGTYHYGLQMEDGSEMWGKQTFREIVRPEKIVLIQSFSNAQGEITRHPLAPLWPRELLATLTFKETPDGHTEFTVSWQPHGASAEERAVFDGARDGMKGGFEGTFGKLDEYLVKTERVLLNSRVVKAPREKVWKALVDPAQVNAWWGPDGFKNIDVVMDVRVGGAWTFTMVGPDGTRYPNHSTYVELKAPERFVYDCGDGSSVKFRGVITLEEMGAHQTLVTLSAEVGDRATRDSFLKFDALEGGRQSLAKLGAFVE